MYGLLYVSNTKGCLSLVVFEVFAKKAFLTSDLRPKSKVMTSSESPYMISYMAVIQNGVSISRCFQDICEKAFSTSDLGPRLKVITPNESPYMISYIQEMKAMIDRDTICIIDIYVYNANGVSYLSLVSKYLQKKTFLTSDLKPRSKVMTPNESPYMISYMSTIKRESLSIIIFEIFAKISILPSHSVIIKAHKVLPSGNNRCKHMLLLPPLPKHAIKNMPQYHKDKKLTQLTFKLPIDKTKIVKTSTS